MSGGGERPDIFVIARLLTCLIESETGLLRSRLAQAAGVNYTVFGRYLARMLASGLVEVIEYEGSRELVRITPRGRDALSFLREGFRTVLGLDSNPTDGWRNRS